jgi:uncharacterized protein
MKTQPLTVIAKPVDRQCNLTCQYCYFHSAPESGSKPMDDQTLAAYIQQVIENATQDDVIFVWQGGEPTLAGLDFFQRAQRWQNMFGNGKHILNRLHTNGVLLNDAWCEFLSEKHWRVDMSLDGLPRTHDRYRTFASDRGSYDAVETAIKLLQTYQVALHAHVTVHAHNVTAPVETYEHLKSLGFRSIQFHPLVPSERSPEVKPWHLRGRAYGEFLEQVLSQWLEHDVGQLHIQDFHSAYTSKNGLPATVCAHSSTCGHTFALLKNGELYSCEHYVGAEHYLGNINHSTLQTLALTPQNVRFGLEKSLALPGDCLACEVLTQCQGGCPRHRLFHTTHSLCDSYQHFFRIFNEQAANLSALETAFDAYSQPV